MSYIEFRNVKKNFGEKQVLKGIDLKVEEGELVTLLGPSGCGKSTLLRCLAGLETLTGGSVEVNGRDLTGVAPNRRNIGMVFQQYSLFPNMNVEENTAFGLKLQKVPRSEIKARVDEMLSIVGLTENRHQYPSQLSGGQQQRAALARALVTRPDVLLLDEPLSAIDALLRHSLQVEIRRLQQTLGITAIFVTHDQEEAMVVSDRIHLMNQGRIEQSGTPAELYTRPRTLFTASFIGHYNILTGQEYEQLFQTSAEASHYAIRPELIALHPASATAPDETAAPAPAAADTTSNASDSGQGSAAPAADQTPVTDVTGVNACGTITMCMPHGNIMRYSVSCGGKAIDVDTLFRADLPFRQGDPVRLVFPKEALLPL